MGSIALSIERAASPAAEKGVVAWARQVYARPVNAPEPAGEWDELVDIEFHNRPEKPEGEGWRPLVLAYTGDGAAPLMMEEREQRDEALLRQALDALEKSSVDTPYGNGFGLERRADERAHQEAIAALRERLGVKA